jgi:hypothetical protein
MPAMNSTPGNPIVSSDPADGFFNRAYALAVSTALMPSRIAWSKLLFPLPFGPISTLKGPSSTSNSLKHLKFSMCIFVIILHLQERKLGELIVARHSFYIGITGN